MRFIIIFLCWISFVSAAEVIDKPKQSIVMKFDLLIDEDDSILTIPFRSFAAAPQKRKTKTDEESISRVASPNSFFLNAALPASGGADDVSLSSSQLTARSGRTKSVVSFCRGATDAYSLVMVSHLRDLRVHTQRADVPVDFVSRLLLRQVAASAAANSASASTTFNKGLFRWVNIFCIEPDE
jgi:hypothetical protein